MTRKSVTRAAALVDDYLPVWIILSVGVGLAVPSVSVLAPLSTTMLAIMVGSISLTLSPSRFRAVRGRVLLAIVAVQATMPLVAFLLARLLGFSPALTAGFVVLGAVTPELVTPVMTELADGDTALAATVLVLVGLGSVAFVPVVVEGLLAGAVPVDRIAIVRELALAVVLPMLLAMGIRWRWQRRVARHDDLYPSVSALMVILVIGIVAAANASLVRSAGRDLVVVLLGAVALNGFGYAAGWLAGRRFSRPERIASTLSVGMRDFAVAAALLLAAGFPAAAALPAVVFGVVEMVSSAGLARYFADG